MAYNRNERAREKGFRNYYEYRKSEAQRRGYSSAREITRINAIREELPDELEENYNPFDIRSNPIWESQVPEELQNSFRLQRAFQRGFLEPAGIGGITEGHHMSSREKLERQYFLDNVPDFDWDMWREYVEEEGNSPGGE